MDEYISRDEVISIIKSKILVPVDNEWDSGYNIALAEMKNVIAQMPTIEAEPVNDDWISIKDRLPDENQKCLVYRDIDNDLKITTGIWHSDRKTFDGLRHGTRLENTIAWMPLPEPPKDGDSDDQP